MEVVNLHFGIPIQWQPYFCLQVSSQNKSTLHNYLFNYGHGLHIFIRSHTFLKIILEILIQVYHHDSVHGCQYFVQSLNKWELLFKMNINFHWWNVIIKTVFNKTNHFSGDKIVKQTRKCATLAWTCQRRVIQIPHGQ